jgi:hypothetical protein|tara:strand:- start:81 stop:269 length:189 start_codon:yes stop_codon:yes gene_type:complete
MKTEIKFCGSMSETTYHDCEIFNLEVCEFTARPIGKVLSPFGLKMDYLKIDYINGCWVCDLD